MLPMICVRCFSFLSLETGGIREDAVGLSERGGKGEGKREPREVLEIGCGSAATNG